YVIIYLKYTCPSEINKIEPVQGQKSNVIVYLNNSEEKLSAKLLIAADGTFSNLAKMADIKTKRSSYAQHAVIANISTDEPHENKAFERFTDQGPLALLPLTRNRMSLVWCQSENRYQNTMTLDDEAFIRELQKNFGFRLGKITKVGERSSYPLSLHLPNEVYNGRILLLGNSAHTLHPIVGQGFNIGLRDIAALVDIIKENLCDGNNDVGGNELLEKYHNQRKADWSKTIGATDSLVRLFSNDYFPLNPVRSKGLWLIDKLPFIKNKIANVAMGFDGDSAKLTRGLK
ncbi:MAG: FAD-dependent monooxygenase, partial [Kangiellaceae bacterium]